jgi:phytoene dehydrogenase-like protein
LNDFDYDVIVVGGGHNGLVTAGYLSKAGLKTLVLERRELVGGACVTEELFPGFRISSCSYIAHLFQEKIIEDLNLRSFGFQVFPLEPRRFAPFLSPDRKKYFLLWHDTEETSRSIGRFSSGDSRSFVKWMDFWTKAAQVIHHYFLLPPPTIPELLSKARELGAEDVMNRILSSSMRDLVEEYFEDEDVRGYFCNAGQDLGDPEAIGGPLSAAYFYCSEFTNPRSYGLVKGGMGGITRALESAVLSHGARVLKGAEVEKILVSDRRVSGVKLKDGRRFSAKAVVSNADPKRTFLKLVDPDSLESNFVTRVRNLQTSISYLKFHCTLRELPDFTSYLGKDFRTNLLAQIRLTAPVGAQKKSWDEVRKGRPSRNPVMSVQIPTVYEPGLAPEGKHIMSIWAQYAPVHPENNTPWDQIREREGRFLIDSITNYAPNVRESIIDWSLFTPAELESRVYLTDGSIRHLDMVPDQMFSSRLDYRTPIGGLYLCGSGTHPGGEVTGAPGYNAAQVVIRDKRN